jgi:hypothetical protein
MGSPYPILADSFEQLNTCIRNSHCRYALKRIPTVRWRDPQFKAKLPVVTNLSLIKPTGCMMIN